MYVLQIDLFNPQPEQTDIFYSLVDKEVNYTSAFGPALR